MTKSQRVEGSSRGPKVAIIGAGISGLCLGLELKRRGFYDFIIYDRDDGIGGTWYRNAYPGCRCDVNILTYSHSRYPKSDWQETHPPRASIAAYWEGIAKSGNLYPYIKLRYNFISAAWNAETKKYDMIFSTPSGEETVSSKFLLPAIGGFATPRIPKIENLETFTGPIIHSAEWPESLTVKELVGKKVAVVGNGCTGTQIVAELARAGDIDVIAIANSHQWLLPSGNRVDPHTARFSPFTRFIHSIPFLFWLKRFKDYIEHEKNVAFFYLSWKNPREPVQKSLADWMQRRAPPELKDVIVPSFPFGAKRVIYDGGFLKALNRPQVTPVWDKLVKTEPNTVITASGKSYEADYLVLATGFDVSRGLKITGRLPTVETERLDHLRFYHTVALVGFPNCFTMLGGNASPSHASVVFSLEVCAEYIATVIVETEKAGIDVIEVKQSALDRYNAWLDIRLNNMVWNRVRQWYRSDGGTGRVFTNWPGPIWLLWWKNLYPIWDDYVGAEPLAKAQRARRRLAIAGTLTCVLAGLWYCLA